MAEEGGADSLIFPAASLSELQPGSDLAVANKIVALVENPQQVAQKAREAMEARLRDLGKIALDEARGALETRIMAEKQIEELPEFYWVAVPMSEVNGYSHVRTEAENLLAARKNCRNFSQPSWGSSRPKSSLDGRRESVIQESISGDSQKMYFYYKAKAGEQLSGVDLLKRLGKAGQRQNFHSTSHMAAMPLRQQLQNTNGRIKQAWIDYIALLPDELKREETVPGARHPVFDHADGSLLFESRLRDYYGKDVPDNVKKALRQFLKQADVSTVNPYYALLLGDGDYMGQTINKLKSSSEHHMFSQTLAGFAGKAQEIVQRYQGSLVYAGGDDVLALLPLHTMLQCAAELADEFRQMMSANEYDEATFSAGIAIFHHTEPLEDALLAARDAEKEAKSVPGKNALAVIEAKRNGTARLVKGKWGEIDRRLLGVAAFYQQEALPHGLAYQLRDMALHLGGETAVTANGDLRKIIKAEATRIIKRKEGSEDAQKYVFKMAANLSGEYPMSQLVNELIIANTVAQAMEQSSDMLPLPLQENDNDNMDH